MAWVVVPALVRIVGDRDQPAASPQQGFDLGGLPVGGNERVQTRKLEAHDSGAIGWEPPELG